MAQAIGNAKKKALSMARKSSFKRISIVLLPGGKTFVYLKDSKPIQSKEDQMEEREGRPIVIEGPEPPQKRQRYDY
jgi:hypothetical protein